MSLIRAIAKTQKIVVDPAQKAVSVINAGPQGPRGFQGIPGIPGTSDASAALTANGQLLTKSGGVLAPITRADLAADSAFTSRYLELNDFTADGQLMTRVSGIIVPVSRATLADDSAWVSKYQRRTSGSGDPSGSGTDGDTYYDTAKKRLFMYNGTGWYPIGGKLPFVKVAKSTGQTVSHNASNVVTFDAADIVDTDNMHDPASNNSRLIAKYSGWYNVNAALRYLAINTPGRLTAWLFKNGDINTVLEATLTGTVTDQDQSVTLTGDVLLAANDYVEIATFNVNGSSLTRTLSEFYTRCSMRYTNLP